MKYKKFIVIGVILIALIYLFNKITHIDHELDQTTNTVGKFPTISYKIDPDDSTLIGETYWKTSKLWQVRRNDHSTPISVIEFNKKFNIIICKDSLVQDKPVRSLISVEYRREKYSSYEEYNTVFNGSYQFYSRINLPTKTDHVFLTLAGDSISNIVKNDSIFSYHLYCDNISMRYSPKNIIDIYAKGAPAPPFGNKKFISMNILFIKRANILYTLMLFPLDYEVHAPPDLLYDIVLNKSS